MNPNTTWTNKLQMGTKLGLNMHGYIKLYKVLHIAREGDVAHDKGNKTHKIQPEVVNYS